MRPRILILGASGVIGHSLAVQLARQGYDVVAIARRFHAGQILGLSETITVPLVELDMSTLARLLTDQGAEVVVNCLGVLQDGPVSSTSEMHEAFVARLLAALRSLSHPVLLVHVSVPGRETDDRMAFSRTKRRGERLVRESGLPTAILRPGFVVAPAAFGGGALLRALGTLPFDLPAVERSRPFGAVAVEDIADTVAWLADTWRADRALHVSFDLMAREQLTLGAAVDLFRQWLGAPRRRRPVVPKLLLAAGARGGDLARCLGWAAPVTTTALAELRRGVAGDPDPWIRTTGIDPRPLQRILRERPATVQERWFARLYLLKPLIIGALALFWCASGLIALVAAYPSAVAILTSRGFPLHLAHAITWLSSGIDIGVGAAIAARRTCRLGLLAGIGVSLVYLAGAAMLTPDLWLEPLGALVKTIPAAVLMALALAILPER